MHIFVKNKKLFVSYYNIKCAVGKRGIGTKKKEGDLITPKGNFKIKSILYRKDRVFNFAPIVSKLPIKKLMGWCDDTRSKQYNKLIRYPFNFSAEKLYRTDNIYDIILVLNYNCNPIRKNKGSAIFIHIAKNNYSATAGCIAISKKDMRKVIKEIDKETIVNIS
jgi:L,D-peptidoglycan transpeptidase YkuD (ErfK/YbiS/YcfS/YnhG family)